MVTWLNLVPTHATLCIWQPLLHAAVPGARCTWDRLGTDTLSTILHDAVPGCVVSQLAGHLEDQTCPSRRVDPCCFSCSIPVMSAGSCRSPCGLRAACCWSLGSAATRHGVLTACQSHTP